MESSMLTELKMAAYIIEKISKENDDNPIIINACGSVLSEIRNSIKSVQGAVPAELRVEITQLYQLQRTLVVLNLIRDVNRFGNGNQDIDESISTVMRLVEDKKNILKEKEINEKNIRR